MSLTAEQFAARMPDGRELLSDEPQMESSLHYEQLALLVSCLEWHWRAHDDFFIGANLTVYYTLEQLRKRRFLGPDFFVVKETERRPRNSWVVWQEGGRYPDLIVELLSESTAKVDRTEKKGFYQNIFRTPEYFWFSPVTLEFAGFRLVDNQYEPIEQDERGLRWSRVLGLYLGVEDKQLRYFGTDGHKIPTPAETAETEIQQAEQERQRAERARERAEQAQERAEQAQERAEQLARKLREMGVDPDSL